MSYIGNQPTSAAFLTDTFSGTGSQTAFTVSAAPANSNSLIVAVSGVLQDPSTYSVSGTTLTFSAAPPAGTGNISVRFLGIPASGVTTTAYRTITEFTATAGQTTFTPPSYTVGFIQVFRNGVLLGSADYTATNGTTVVLTSGATAGDLVTTLSFYVSSVVNAIPATVGAVNQNYIATGVAGTGPAFSVYLTGGNQSISTLTWTKVNLNGEVFDTANCFDNVTNYRFTPNVAGYYQFNMGLLMTLGSGTTSAILCALAKNGSRVVQNECVATVPNGQSVTLSHLVYMNGSTDYAEMQGYVSSSSGAFTSGSDTTFFSGFLARAA